MTKDRNRGISSIDYNALNLPKAIHYGDYSSISNTYTAEGEKLFRLTLINNNGWPTPIGNLTPPNMTSYVTHYCGNMVYSSQSNQSESELMLIDGGYVTFDGTTPKYHFYIQDHLGNNRAVVSQTGVVEQQAQYYPSGAVMTSISEGISQQPYLYSGKELDRMHGLDWYDYGARHYDAALLRWHSMDPMCEKYYHISPYAFCMNNFVNAFDPDGTHPIYDEEGNLIGTDDEGLQGEAIVMAKENFHSGISAQEAIDNNIGISGLKDLDAFKKYAISIETLPNRPDWDGMLTLEEANEWYRNGDGEPLYVDAKQIDLSNFVSLGDQYIGEKYGFNLLTSGNSKDGLVYGNLIFERISNDGVIILPDTYDFDMHSWTPSNFVRNVETLIGMKVAGSGVPFKINFYGHQILRKK